MRKELVVKGRTLTGTSDLTLLAPIIPGLVPSLDAITYKTRVKRLLKTLQGGRASMHEYSAWRPLSDSVERVAAIHSFRVVVLEPEDKVMLAVTFDGTWESYIRILWQKVGTLLDIIFCNTHDYVLSTRSFEEWTGWVRRVQVETSFFYNTHGLTVDDVAYLRGQERIHCAAEGGTNQALAAARHCARSAESIAWEAALKGPLEVIRQGLQSLAVLFRMTDTYLPGTPDGEVLRRAARDLLQEFLPAVATLDPVQTRLVRVRFARQLDWLTLQPPPPRQVPALPPAPVNLGNLANVQAGIVRPYKDMTHGCLLLIAVDDRAAAVGLLDHLLAVTTFEGTPHTGIATNVAVTYEGLRALGLSEAQLELFPQEFREGMEARASMLGDFRANHPRRWQLPVANWGGAADPTARIDMASVHLVVQLRIACTDPHAEIDPTSAKHPLHAGIARIVEDGSTKKPRAGIRVLAVQGMNRLFGPHDQVVEHFGFADGGSDPGFEQDAGKVYPNRVHLGEVLIGRDNESDPAWTPVTPQEKERHAWLYDGSFLVVRKLAQHVERLHNLLLRACAETGLPREVILAKMMGRAQDGKPLVPAPTSNDFDYAGDADGARCPFHSHIRRSNPRTAPPAPGQAPVPPGGRHPRLARRGMSYGPRFDLPKDLTARARPDGVDRGLVFMAYNASISEQFEVVQRWISGGNSTGGHSGQGDPFLGVPDWNERRVYRFEAEGTAHAIALDAAPEPGGEPEPLVRLEWGMYLFTPSKAALGKLRAVAAAGAAVAPPWSADEGKTIVDALLALEGSQPAADVALAWKEALEDPEAQEKYRSASVWAAIRRYHGGALRTPYGVLVAERALVAQVLGDTQGYYSVSGYRERMADSIGEIYLGLDPRTDGEYERQSQAANQAISALGERQAFALAFAATGAVLAAFIGGEKKFAASQQLPTWELNLDAKEVGDRVLASLCQHWFGLPSEEKGDIIVPGSWRWDWQPGQPPIYPAHFTAPSRYIFQPLPGDEVRQYGHRIGRALTAALRQLVAKHRAAGTVPTTPAGAAAPLAAAIMAAFPGDDDLTARVFCGALMGFLPTVDGNFRLSLNELLRDGTFWSLRAAWGKQADPGLAHGQAKALLEGPLRRAMQLRPSPELVWRRAAGDGLRIGKVDLWRGDTVVLALVAATQQCLAAGDADVSAVFGGNRRAQTQATHACPAYDAGMGVLLGMLAGFLNVAELMRASPVPLAFTFEGRVP